MQRILFVLFVLIAMPSMQAFAKKLRVSQDDFTGNFVGHIGLRYAFEMSLTKQGNECIGTYNYLNYKQSITLKGKFESSAYIYLNEYTKSGKINATFKLEVDIEGKIIGTWLKEGKSDTEALEVVLYRQEALATSETEINSNIITKKPENISENILENIIREALEIRDSTKLIEYLVDNNLIINDKNTFTFIPIFWQPMSDGLRPDSLLHISVAYQNLFGTDEKEAIITIDYGSDVYFLSFFYKEGQNWKQVPNILNFNRGSYDNMPCLRNSEIEVNYFSYQFQELRIANEFCIVGQINGGRCADGSNRGNEISFNVWQITKNGVFKLFSDTKSHYWYKSPSPEPVSKPIERSFEFSKEDKFSKYLSITQTRYKEIIVGVADFPKKVGEVSLKVKLKFVE
jgi:hypothetical protein